MGDILAFTLVWILVSALGEIGIQSLIHHGVYYYTATTQALDGEAAFAFIITVLTPVFAFIVVMIGYDMIRFRSREPGMRPSPRQFYNNKVFVSIWILVSIALNLLFFVHPTASAVEQMFNSEKERYNRHDLIINVTARQWQWLFDYPQYNITQAQDANGNSILYLPVDRTVRFVLRSYDPMHMYDPYAGVIHSFWIPAFGVKQDIIPGETRYMYVHTNKVTSYNVDPMVRVQCAEVCGPGHPFMEAPVHVVSNVDFMNWIKQQQKLQAGQS
ncbi:cytochrome c oxidase subunit II [Sulfoacidibacillus thermotolerans]|uniref:cytochrome-c oxidase n=1 Tax=Sulfoacidibacillus thermotolerans TaxID=1765684 RepID=A0A2U3D953_SULT2|nr:cytochrome c oxidase subunit II [Sulfoacidibacillus thermotolerans]PWI57818.1 cytochrome c oxidase subunit II [Sulfoacidibacillus thermotolerans]